MHVRPVLCPYCDAVFVVPADRDLPGHCQGCGAPLPAVSHGLYCTEGCYLEHHEQRDLETPSPWKPP